MWGREYEKGWSRMSRDGRFLAGDFVRSNANCCGALAARSALGSSWHHAMKSHLPKSAPDSLGLTSYTFRNFTPRAVDRLHEAAQGLCLNAKDVKDHLPRPTARVSRARDYAGPGITLHAAGAIYFPRMRMLTYGVISNIASEPIPRMSPETRPSKLCRE